MPGSHSNPGLRSHPVVGGGPDLSALGKGGAGPRTSAAAVGGGQLCTKYFACVSCLNPNRT